MHRRWQDSVSFALGLWLFFSPFLLSYTGGAGSAASWNAYILGVAIVAFSAAALARPAQWEEWINLALGAWLVISPWVLAFAGDDAATWNQVVVGLIVGGDAIWAMTRSSRVYG